MLQENMPFPQKGQHCPAVFDNNIVLVTQELANFIISKVLLRHQVSLHGYTSAKVVVVSCAAT
jgi:hypothetical protein